LEDLQAILDKLPRPAQRKNHYLLWNVGKTEISYFPQSIAPVNEFPIDTDGKHVLPFHGIDCHLDDRNLNWEMNDDVILTNPDLSYQNLIKKWRKVFGEKVLQEEKRVFKNYF